MEVRRVTLKDLAREAGVSVMTVSYALRHHPRISAKRREAIQTLARERGYRPDPALSALATYRKQLQSRHFTGLIAYLTFGTDSKEWTRDSFVRLSMEAAAGRARELGYELTPFWAGDPDYGGGKLDRILKNRGIEGLLLTRQHQYRTPIPIDLDAYAVVGTSRSLDWTGFDFVTTNHYNAIVRACQTCLDRGYTRIGLISSVHLEQRLNQRMVGAFFGMQHAHGTSNVEFLPPCPFEDGNPEPVCLWFQRHRPDVIICHRADEIHPALTREGWRIPEDCALLHPLLLENVQGFSGIHEPVKEIGTTAINMLHDQLMLRQRGKPAHPKSVALDGPWFEGATLPWKAKRGKAALLSRKA